MCSHSETGGVKDFSIAGRMAFERERLTSMTDEERRWRAQYLKDQILPPEEPRFVPELYKETNNIFRRLFRYPLNIVELMASSVIGKRAAKNFRSFTGATLKLMAIGYVVVYYVKYHSNDWTDPRRPLVFSERPQSLPGDPEYPHVRTKEKHEYYDIGFSKSHFFKSA